MVKEKRLFFKDVLCRARCLAADILAILGEKNDRVAGYVSVVREYGCPTKKTGLFAEMTPASVIGTLIFGSFRKGKSSPLKPAQVVTNYSAIRDEIDSVIQHNNGHILSCVLKWSQDETVVKILDDVAHDFDLFARAVQGDTSQFRGCFSLHRVCSCRQKNCKPRVTRQQAKQVSKSHQTTNYPKRTPPQVDVTQSEHFLAEFTAPPNSPSTLPIGDSQHTAPTFASLQTSTVPYFQPAQTNVAHVQSDFLGVEQQQGSQAVSDGLAYIANDLHQPNAAHFEVGSFSQPQDGFNELPPVTYGMSCQAVETNMAPVQIAEQQLNISEEEVLRAVDNIPNGNTDGNCFSQAYSEAAMTIFSKNSDFLSDLNPNRGLTAGNGSNVASSACISDKEEVLNTWEASYGDGLGIDEMSCFGVSNVASVNEMVQQCPSSACISDKEDVLNNPEAFYGDRLGIDDMSCFGVSNVASVNEIVPSSACDFDKEGVLGGFKASLGVNESVCVNSPKKNEQNSIPSYGDSLAIDKMETDDLVPLRKKQTPFPLAPYKKVSNCLSPNGPDNFESDSESECSTERDSESYSDGIISDSDGDISDSDRDFSESNGDISDSDGFISDSSLLSDEEDKP